MKSTNTQQVLSALNSKDSMYTLLDEMKPCNKQTCSDDDYDAGDGDVVTESSLSLIPSAVAAIAHKF